MCCQAQGDNEGLFPPAPHSTAQQPGTWEPSRLGPGSPAACFRGLGKLPRGHVPHEDFLGNPRLRDPESGKGDLGFALVLPGAGADPCRSRRGVPIAHQTSTWPLCVSLSFQSVEAAACRPRDPPKVPMTKATVITAFLFGHLHYFFWHFSPTGVYPSRL